jgi:DNA-binding CsgD family transcriptional regulator
MRSNFGEATMQPTMASVGLTPRQRETLAYLATGASEKQVAQAMGISVHTVHIHAKQIYRRLNVSSRGELMAAVFLEVHHQGGGDGGSGKPMRGKRRKSYAELVREAIE